MPSYQSNFLFFIVFLLNILSFSFVASSQEGHEVYLANAIRLYNEGKMTQSIDGFTKVIEKEPDFAMAYYYRGIAYEWSGNKSQAIVDYRSCLDIDSTYVDAVYALGMIYLKSGEAKKSVHYFNKSIKLQPGTGDMHLNRGIAFMELNNLNGAYFDFMEALNSPGSKGPELYNALCNVMMKKGGNEKALEYVNKAIEYDSLNLVYQLNRAILYNRLSKTDFAKDELQRIINKDSLNFDAHYEMASVFEKKGKMDSAIYHLKTCADVQPTNLNILNDLATLLINTGQHEESLNYLNQCIFLDSTIASLYINRAMTQFYLKAIDLALSDLNRAIILEPKNHGALITRCKILWNTGKNDEACADVKRLQELGFGDHEEVLKIGGDLKCGGK